MDRSMGREFIIGQTVQNMEVNGNKMRCTELANSFGQTVGSIKGLLLWV